MKKKIIVAIAAIAVSATTIIGLSSFTSKSKTDNHTDCQGKYCSYTVGCDCTGFAPITNGEEWQKEYCRRCGHKKLYH